MASETATVRHARLEDVPAILQLIRELADYEHEIDSVEATEEKLISTIAFAPSSSSSSSGSSGTGPAGLPVTEPTSPQKPARCLLVISPATGAPVGMALYFYNYSTWRARPGIYLEDLFVQPSQRKKGYGKLLLVQLAKEVIAMDGGRLEWAVLKWNEPSIKFYESIGAQMMSEWVGMRVDREGLVKLSKLLD
ncbi:putative n-acetyltransferase ats1 protein [Phaeoacremonium minimum UCRPA7]|uniref:Putative n-acetyltransferase ats1 protein n=1 Tax=Phaeoacremonium minimum (strain UCR-PA7) TaxID=1286976 RepID=R8BJ87_PHAM7|nr:putative n-acetyltransferase ats1 protein [Phaeoacremonium minimum UCRPA7]EON99403.1 putative n-acetyltransferase ats1 protein [Phaeoacremonium minimum UCRPA7]